MPNAEAQGGAAEGFDAVAYINEPRWRASSYGLERIEALLSALGNPERDFRVIHVAGTNGKGSTCAYLDAILRQAGFHTGLFTSPFIERFEERIRVDGHNISPSDLLSCTLAVKSAVSTLLARGLAHPTEFELMCAVAMLHFSRSHCQWAVIEVGLGGRLDATNVVSPELAVICRIGLDHTELLGSTLAAISEEKAGIIKPGAHVISYPQDEEAMAPVARRCAEVGAALTVADFSALDCGDLEGAALRRHFVYQGVSYQTSLLGRYQPENAALAIEAAACLGLDLAKVREGISQATWPGRFEVVCQRPLVIVDGSHNPQGAAALAESLAEVLGSSGKKVSLVVGVLEDKDYENVVAPLLSFAHRVLTYTPDNPRALAGAALEETVQRLTRERGLKLSTEVEHTAGEALCRAMEEEGPEGVVLAFGTLYAIADLKRAIREG